MVASWLFLCLERLYLRALLKKPSASRTRSFLLESTVVGLAAACVARALNRMVEYETARSVSARRSGREEDERARSGGPTTWSVEELDM